MEILELAKKAKDSAREIAGAPTVLKNKILNDIALLLEQNTSSIISENKKDMNEAKNLSSSLQERLMLDEKRLKSMYNAILEVAELEDPVGEVLSMKKRPSGIQIGRMRVPIGVICVIYNQGRTSHRISGRFALNPVTHAYSREARRA